MFKKYKEQYARVLTWNSIARNDKLPDIESQEAVCYEEVKETIIASTTIDKLDGYCDVFVTGAFLEYMDKKHKFLPRVYKEWDEGLDNFGDELIFACLNEVLDSNDTKIPKEEDVDIDMEKYLLEKETGLSIYPTVNKGRVSFIDENGKIRKPSTYVPPDLEKVISKFYGGE